MSDEEDYDSEDDLDYVPAAEDVSEEENSGEEEDLSVLGNNEKLTGPRQKKQSKKNVLGPRKRKGGIKLDEEKNNDKNKETEVDEENVKLAKEIEEEKQKKKEVVEKKKADDLWSSFLSDVKPPPKKTVTASPGLGSLCTLSKSKESDASPSVSKSGDAPTKTVEITKVFDFAGEEVKVTKTVAADSKEAKKELKSKEEEKEESTASNSGVSVLSNIGIKRPASRGGLGGILSKIGKKQKISVLDKSKMDWNNFKKDEGIEDELKIHNNSKQGYIERMKFLERTDLRQFEIEKSLRQSSKRS